MLQGLVGNRIATLPEVTLCPSHSSTAPSPDCRAQHPQDEGLLFPLRTGSFLQCNCPLMHEKIHPCLRGCARYRHLKSVIIVGSLLEYGPVGPSLSPTVFSNCHLKKMSVLQSEGCCLRGDGG